MRTLALTMLLAAGASVAGCADLSQEQSVPSDLTFSQQAPDALTSQARAVLAALPPDTATVEHGVVLAETPDQTWYARVLIRGGVAVLQENDNCDDWQEYDWWRQQIVPGDAIEWSPKGNTVCPGQVSVTEAGAALAPTTVPTKGK